MTVQITTNIRLPKDMLKRLKLRAVEEEKSVSQLIREAIENYLFGKTTSPPDESQTDPIMKIIGIAQSGIKDGSIAHDRYLHGKR